MDRIEQLKTFLRRMLPVLRAVARVTPNMVDDQAVAFLAAWLESDSTDMPAFAATYSPTA